LPNRCDVTRMMQCARKGTDNQCMKNPPRWMCIGLVTDGGLGWVAVRIGAS
jgi:hypothetical protein